LPSLEYPNPAGEVLQTDVVHQKSIAGRDEPLPAGSDFACGARFVELPSLLVQPPFQAAHHRPELDRDHLRLRHLRSPPSTVENRGSVGEPCPLQSVSRPRPRPQPPSPPGSVHTRLLAGDGRALCSPVPPVTPAFRPVRAVPFPRETAIYSMPPDPEPPPILPAPSPPRADPALRLPTPSLDQS